MGKKRKIFLKIRSPEGIESTRRMRVSGSGTREIKRLIRQGFQLIDVWGNNPEMVQYFKEEMETYRKQIAQGKEGQLFKGFSSSSMESLRRMEKMRRKGY